MRKLTAIIVVYMACAVGSGYADGPLHASEGLKVKAKKKHYHTDGTRCYSDWTEYDTRTIDQLPGFAGTTEPALSAYGGRMDQRREGTGFFRAERAGDRWWLIDPEGYRFIHAGIVSVRPGTSKNQEAALKQKFGSEQAWLEQSVKMLKAEGFNGAGNWSDADLLKTSAVPVAYTRGFNFMAGYGKKRGGTFQQPGHTGYPNDLIFVFDPAFARYCDEEARQAARYKEEPALVGYFSDNEMPFPEDALDRYLSLDTLDAGFRAASQWLLAHKGVLLPASELSSADRAGFLEYMAEKYFSIVSAALKKYDPNHLYLGCRFHGETLRQKPVFHAAGKYCDVISVNYYDVWTPSEASLASWSGWSGRPLMITEWYTKADDSGLGNQTGAGWIVPTQRDRGLFYQNFTLALLESKVCVGWHWFKYQDNDPADKKSDPSNADANKGIVNNSFEPYAPLLQEMRAINTHLYGLADYFTTH